MIAWQTAGRRAPVLAMAAWLVGSSPGDARVVPTPWLSADTVRSPVAAAELYETDLAHSSLEFNVSHLGLTNVRGVFHDWNAALLYDEAHPTHSSLTVVVRVASLDTGNGSRDRDLRSDHFFDVETHPRAVFQTTSIEPRGEGFLARGLLTIKGVSREVAIPFRRTGRFDSPTGHSTQLGFTGELTIERADYGVVQEGGILEKKGAIGKTARIEIQLAAIRLHPAALPFRGAEAGPASIGPELLDAARAAGPSAAVARLDAALRSDPPTRAVSQGELSKAEARLFAAGDTATALEVQRRWTEARPTDAEAHLELGEALLAAGEREEAVAEFRRALRLAPFEPRAVERVRQLTASTDRATVEADAVD